MLRRQIGHTRSDTRNASWIVRVAHSRNMAPNYNEGLAHTSTNCRAIGQGQYGLRRSLRGSGEVGVLAVSSVLTMHNAAQTFIPAQRRMMLEPLGRAAVRVDNAP